MKRLHLFIIKAFIGPFILNLVITDFLFLMIWVWKYVDDLIGKGLEFTVLLKIIGYVAVWHVPMYLPLSILIASIMTFGKLGETNELTAIKSLGISLQKTMYSLIVFISALSVGTFFFSNNVLPVTALRMQSLLSDIVHKKPELNIPEGLFYNGIENYTIRIEKKYKNQTMKGIMLFDHTNNENNSFIVADSGKIETLEKEQFMKLTLLNGHAFDEDKNDKNITSEAPYPFLRSSFEQHIIYIDLSSYAMQNTENSGMRSGSQMLNLKQLKHYIDSLNNEVKMREVSLNKELSDYYYFPKDNMLVIDSVKPFVLAKKLTPLIPADKAEIVFNEAQQSARSAQGYANRSSIFTEDKKSSRYRYEVEWHKKYTLSVSCLLLFFIGAPFGAIVRKGGLGWPVVFAILLFLVYYVVSIIGEKVSKSGGMSTFTGMWLASFVLAPIGVFLSYKATRDSKLFSKPAFIGKLKPLFTFSKKKES